jgi:hypothetical protein
MMRSVSTPARMASGLPPKVVPWLPGPKTSAARGPATTAPIGTPEPRPLASGITSGRMPAHWWANHLPVRPMPHCTSSSISSQSAGRRSRRRPAQVVGGLGLMPPSPWMVSRNTATTLGCWWRLRERGQVVQRHAHEALDQRAEAGLHLGVAGGRQRGDRAAVEGLLVDDDLGPLDALVVAELARDLQRRFVGLEARCCRRRPLVRPDSSTQFGRQRFLQRHLVVVRAVDQLGHLVLQRRHQLRVVVAQRVDGDAGQAVEVALAVGVPDPAASAVRQRDRQRGRRCSSRAAVIGRARGVQDVPIKEEGHRRRPACPIGHRRPGIDSKACTCVAENRMPGLRSANMLAAPQHFHGTMRAPGQSRVRRRLRLLPAGRPEGPSRRPHVPPPNRASSSSRASPRQGKTFRPSDWAERLAGAMSCFRPGDGGRHRRAHRLFAVLRAAGDRRRQVRDRQRGAARPRADGLGLRHELRARQRAAGGRSLPDA